MHTFRHYLILLLVWMPVPLVAQQYAHAGEYMAAMQEGYAQFKEDLWTYVKTAAHGKNASKTEEKRRTLIQTTHLVQKKVSRMPVYEDDAGLRDGTAAYLKLIYNVLNEDYAKIVDLMEAYLLAKEMAGERMDEAASLLSEEEAAFAARHNIRLIEAEKSKTTLNLEAAGRVMGYYNRVYLLFFKSYKQEAYLIEAAQKGDVNALVQNQNALKRDAAEGLAMLDTMSAYQGDGSLKAACADMLSFYLDEAIHKAPVLSGFYLQKENFEQIKAAFDAKKQSERSQADVENYNQAVTRYNQAISDYNRTSESLHEQRGKLLAAWNKTAPKFLDRHVP